MKKRLLVSETGFTLLELIIVMVIMVIVMQVVFISTKFFTEDQTEQSVEEMNSHVNNALVLYYGTMGSFPEIHDIDAGNTYENISKNDAEDMILKIQQVTGFTLNKDYSYSKFKMNVDFVNSYVMKITFEKR